MTQKELAESLGLSQATISFALSGRLDKVSGEVVRRVQEHVAKSGYRKPRRNVLRRGDAVAVLLPEPHPAEFMEGAILKMLRGFQAEAEREGWQVLQKICNSPESFKRALSQVSGCMAICALPAKDWEGLGGTRVPFVVANGLSPLPQSDSVMPDNSLGVKRAVEALFNLGHRRIGFFGISEMGEHHGERLAGYYEGMAAQGLCPDFAWAFLPQRGDRSLADTERLCRELVRKLKSMEAPPTALVCPADVYSLAIARVAKEEGLAIPEELSLIGFDNTEECLVATPRLSSLASDFLGMGEEAARILSDRMRSPERPSRVVRLEPTLFLRESARSLKAC